MSQAAHIEEVAEVKGAAGSGAAVWNSAPLPEFEEARLFELRELNVIDTEPEARFDRLTALAASLLEFPAVLISLVDKDQVFFKSNHGFEGVGKISRDISICAYAVLERDALIIPDTTQDARFASNPLVTGDAKLRFYAGAVLRGPTGQPLGTMCLVDTEPRELSPKQAVCLRSLADMVEDELQTNSRMEALKSQAIQAMFLDTSTGLPNRRYILESLEKDIANHPAPSVKTSTINKVVARIDLSHCLNPLRGRELLEDGLQMITHRIKSTLANHEVLGRWSQDQLVVIVNAPQSITTALCRVEEIVDQLGVPFRIGALKVRPSPSVGVSLFPQLSQDADTLLRQAGLAVEYARRDPESSMSLFSAGVGEEVSRQGLLEERLLTALEDDKLSVVFQPRVDTQTGRMVSAEALVRWHDDVLGFVSPAEFIPMAERLNIIGELDLWVLEQSVAQFKAWQNEGLPAIPVSVNLAGADLVRETLPQEIAQVLRRYDLPPHLLELEVTEHSVIEDIDRARGIMEATRALGVIFALDDFGTGYSSLSYLTSIPVDVIKIDRSFVQKMNTSSQALRLVGSIISMAKGLGARLVAEGAETADEVARLQELQCEEVQGYYFSRPLKPVDFRALLKAQRPLWPDFN